MVDYINKISHSVPIQVFVVLVIAYLLCSFIPALFDILRVEGKWRNRMVVMRCAACAFLLICSMEFVLMAISGRKEELFQIFGNFPLLILAVANCTAMYISKKKCKAVGT